MDERKFGKLVVLIVFVVVLIYVILMIALRVQTANKKSAKYDSYEESLIVKAKDIYLNKKDAGMDFNSGPCLTDELAPDWVLDIAHDPREPIDNLPENQCPAFREGRANHFIELDVLGRVIKVK